MNDLSALTKYLVKDEQGVWRSDADRAVSYSEEGHDSCFKVESDSFWFQHRNRCIVAVANRFPPPGNGLIFDIGGGNGVVSEALASAGFRTALLEPGESGVQNARRRGVDTILCTTFEHANFPSNSLAAVGLFDVIEHVQKDQEFLRQLWDSLAPGGRLYATVPAHRWLWSSEDEDAGHFRRYTLQSITDDLGLAGLKVTYATYFFWFLPAPIWLLRAVPYKFGRSRGKQTERDHGTDSSATNKLLTRLLEPEAKRIEAGEKVPVGASCLVVATKA